MQEVETTTSSQNSTNAMLQAVRLINYSLKK